MFKEVLFVLFKDAENCDRVIYKFMRAYDMFNKNVSGFGRMSTTNQYYICETALRMTIAESDQVMRKVSIFRDRNKPTKNEINYSVDYGYVEPAIIDISDNNIQIFSDDVKGRNKRT